jgi:hypothetical protein
MIHSGRAVIGAWQPGKAVHVRLACWMNEIASSAAYPDLFKAFYQSHD